MTERDSLAAELALGLLEGEPLVEARGLAASDPDFAALVAAWEERFAPWFEEFGEEMPPAELWAKIRAAIDQPGSGEVVTLRTQVGRWRAVAGAMSAIAAALLLVVTVGPLRPNSDEPGPTASEQPTSPIMVASLMSKDRHDMLMSATWAPASASLMVTPGDMPPAAGHSHELWIIPADGKPRSLGIVHGGQPARMAMPAEMAGYFANAATLAITVEPEGGAPGDGPTGPVVASGSLTSV